MRDYLIENRRCSKHQVLVDTVRFALATGKSVVIGTVDQAATIARFKDDFSGALFSLVGECGLKIHLRRKRRETSQG